MEKKEEKKRKTKKIIFGGIVVLAATALGGVLAYKKCPKFKGLIDSGVSKMFKGGKKDTVDISVKIKERPNRTYEKL